VVVAVAVAVPAVPAIRGVADPGGGVERLEEIDRQTGSTKVRLEWIDRRTTEVVKGIDRAQTRLAQVERTIRSTKVDLDEALQEHARISDRMDLRGRVAFIQGPASMMSLLSEARSIADIGFGLMSLEKLNGDDDTVAEKVRWTAAMVAARKAQLVQLRGEQQRILRGLRAKHRKLTALFREQRALLERLGEERAAVVDALNRYQPLWVCPVRGPNAYHSSFGYRRPEGAVKNGRMPVHQGVDIFAPYGTPIVAPFDGTAVLATNPVGGYAVRVYGARGFVYNAHLSRIGTLGAVGYGTVVGYVGDSGNAHGTSPHDHFEWHPGDGAAADPYPLLNQAC
jgi:murein DD-endopeptidase MepM/ murein hydrolase activator NlpD